MEALVLLGVNTPLIYLLTFDILSSIFHLLRCVGFDTGCFLPLYAHRSYGSSSRLFGSARFCGVWFEMSSLVVSIRLVSSSSVYIFWCPPCPCWLQDIFGIDCYFKRSWDRLVPTAWSFWFIVHGWFRWFRSELLVGSSNFCGVLFGAAMSWQVSPW
jgi:hypothetical protein